MQILLIIQSVSHRPSPDEQFYYENEEKQANYSIEKNRPLDITIVSVL